MTALFSIDPPWDADSGGGGKGANAKYDLLNVRQIAQVIRMAPTWSDVDPLLVWMWVTQGALCQGDFHALTGMLSLHVSTCFVWWKGDDVTNLVVPANDDDADIIADRLIVAAPRRAGTGQWQRCEHEYLFLCRRGSMPLPATPYRHRSLVPEGRGEHSAKPEAAWRVIERTSASILGRTCGGTEVFARQRRQGWDAYGHLEWPSRRAVHLRAEAHEEWRHAA